MRASHLILSATVVTTVVFAGCGKPTPPPQAPPPPAVVVARPVPYKVQAYHEYNGYLEAVDRVEVRPQVEGLLTKVHFTEGSEVVKGKTVLYSIDKRDYDAALAKAEADIAKAKADAANSAAQIRLSEAKVARLKAAGPGASKTELDEAQATVEANNAALKSAKANIQAGEAAKSLATTNLERTDIVAEISGQVGQTLVTQGNLVQAKTTLLTTIVKNDKLFVKFDIPEKNWIEFTKTRATPSNSPVGGNLAVEVGVATDLGFPHHGTIDFNDNQVERATGTISIRGRLDNPKREGGKPPLLYSGLYAKVRVPIGEEQVLPAIPEEALQSGQEGQYVYVVGDDNVVKKRTVTTLPEKVWKAPAADSPQTPGWTLAGGDGGPTPLQSVVAVSKGLTPQDRVVVNGVQAAQRARPNTPAAPEMRTLTPPPAK